MTSGGRSRNNDFSSYFLKGAECDINIPKNETVWERIFDDRENLRFVVTSNAIVRDWYYLYEVSQSGTLAKIGKAKTPSELKLRFSVEERLRSKNSIRR